MKGASVESKQGCFWIGVDVSKAVFDAALAQPGQHYSAARLREMPTGHFERSAKGVKSFLRWMRNELKGESKPRVRVVMESTGQYSMILAKWMLGQCPMLAPAIVNPRQTANYIKSLGLRNSTDQLAARALAFYGVERSPEAYTPPPPEYAELQALHRYRDALMRERVSQMNRGREGYASAIVERMHRQHVRRLEKDIKRIEAEMTALVKRHAKLSHDITLLSSMYGIAFITAAAIIAELGDLRRFQRARQLVAFVGLNPCLIESGSSVRKRVRMSKRGNARVRKALYMPAMTAVRGDNSLRRMYERLIKAGKEPMAALGAVMRKMLTIMRALIISGKSYQPLWRTPGENYAHSTQPG